jgi:6-phosphogluconolactonase
VAKRIVNTNTNLQSVRWHLYRDSSELIDRSVAAIARIAEHSILARGEFSIVLAGGTTPRAIYERLAVLQSPWDRWVVFFGDERCLPVDDPERNSVMARVALLDRVPLPAGRVFEIPAELGPERAAMAYRKTLEQVGSFDLVLLGLGEDGHTASLFPGQVWGERMDDPIALPVHNAPKPPPDRVSISANRLSHAREVMVLVSGSGKAAAVAAWRAGERLPITAITPDPGVDVLVTADAWGTDG